MSGVVSGLIGAVVAFALVTVAERKQKSARPNVDGWHTLRPGWLLNGVIVGCALLAGLMGYLLLSGGSTRPDADTQNIYAALLLAGFGGAAAYFGWTCYGRTVMWKGNKLRLRTSLGREVMHRMSDVSSVTKSEMWGEYRLTFRDGSSLRFSAYFHGAGELAAKLSRKAFRD